MQETEAIIRAMPTLATAVAPTPVSTIDDAVAVMQAIDQALPQPDGLKWFNFLYLAVTEAVRDAIASGNVYSDDAWVTHLDVTFANLYFAAVSASLGGPAPMPRAWEPLFESRLDLHIARVQYAVAGMNAHINRDLTLALVSTHVDLNTIPDRKSVHFQDFKRVDDLLVVVEAQVKAVLLTGVLVALDGTLGPLDDVLAMWSVTRARDGAWTNSEVLWSIRPLSFLTASFVESMDRITGFAGRGLLLPTQL